jgi:hypothetical protein
MLKTPIYLAYGLLLIGLSGWANYRGWSFARVNEIRSVPKTVRDNPGSYRSPYLGYHRYTGGK